MSDPVRSRQARELAERALVRLVHTYGDVPEFVLLGGLVLAASFVRAFRRAGTPVNPGESATTLVTTGPYRLSRNPAYLGMALGYAGIAILSGALWALVPLVPTLLLIDRGVIRREERHLERKFGEEYLLYRARTRRWL